MNENTGINNETLRLLRVSIYQFGFPAADGSAACIDSTVEMQELDSFLREGELISVLVFNHTQRQDREGFV